MYNYGPGQPNPGDPAQEPGGNPYANPTQPAYGAPGGQPQYPSPPGQSGDAGPAYSDPPGQAYGGTSPQPSVDPYAPAAAGTSGPPANVPGQPTTGPPHSPPPGGMFPPPGAPAPGAKSGSKAAVPVLAGLAGLLLIAAVVFGVLYLNKSGEASDQASTISGLNSDVEELEGRFGGLSDEEWESLDTTVEDLVDDLEDKDDVIDVLESDLAVAEAAADDAEGLQQCLDSLYDFLIAVADEEDQDTLSDLSDTADDDCSPYW